LSRWARWGAAPSSESRIEVQEPDLTAPVDRLLKAVVIRDGPARRQRAPLCGDVLGQATQIDLGLEQPVTLAAILAGLTGKTDVRICRQRD
jgi:hypothetical protein